MNGILYFSSTGNSLYIAKKVQEKFGGKILFIPKYADDGREFERIFIVTPIHSFGMPAPVFDFLPNLNKKTEIIVIQNYGGMIGGADFLFLQYAQKLGLNLKSLHTIKMPENFTLSFTVPKFYMNRTLKNCEENLKKIFEKIEANSFHLPKKRKTKEKTYLKNKSNWHLIGKVFCANENCMKCGKCIKLCPVGNIEIKDGKISFKENCIACLSCYHRCPNKAIQYKQKKKKFRYINPNINENEIGLNFEGET